MVNIITATIIKNVGDTIAQYAFGKLGDKFCDTFSAKIKIKKILKEDKKFIEKQFEKRELETLHVEEFLFQEIFQDSKFLYPVSAIPEDRVELLWEMYCAYMMNKHDTHSENDVLFKSKLEKCVNKHNELVNTQYLSESDRIILKTMQRGQSDLLGYIGKTLDANSELQSNHAELDYTHKQIEGILHAFRMDMRHYKLLLMLNSVGIIIFAIISIIVLPRIIENISTSNLLDFAFMPFILLFLTFLFCISLRNVKNCENRIAKYMESLWEIHFANYKKQFNLLFEINEVTTDS